IGVQDRRKAPRFYVFRKRPQERQLPYVITVHKYELSARRPPERDSRERISRQPVALIGSRLETDLHEWGHCGIPPLLSGGHILMPRARDPKCGEARERRLANLVDPGRSLNGPVLLEPLKVREITL